MSVCDHIANCSKEFNKKTHTLKDPKGTNSRYIYASSKDHKFYEISFDGCVFGDDISKCDYGIKNEQKIYFIELKGSDLSGGMNQLLTTIQSTKNCFKGLKVEARLIVSGVKKPAIYKLTKEYRNLMKELGGETNFVMRTNEFEEKVA